MKYTGYDLLDLKLLLVIRHTTKNGTPVDAMLGDTNNCLCEGEVDACEVLRNAVVVEDGPLVASSRLCPRRNCAVSGLHFRVAYAAGDRTSAIDAASR